MIYILFFSWISNYKNSKTIVSSSFKFRMISRFRNTFKFVVTKIVLKTPRISRSHSWLLFVVPNGRRCAVCIRSNRSIRLHCKHNAALKAGQWHVFHRSKHVYVCFRDKYNFRLFLVLMILLPYYSDETNTNSLYDPDKIMQISKLKR